MSEAAIGIFDSGVGGLTVARAVLDQLPAEPIVYVGDTANGPYGPRPIASVRALSLAVMDHLVGEGVKMLVIACNTASAAVLRDARERYPVPVVEVISPAVRGAITATRNSRVGVICTQATMTSKAYPDAFTAAPHVQLTVAAAPRFVEFAERGRTTGDEVLTVARDYLAPLIDADVDTVVLGCTHYPLLAGAIAHVLGPEVTLINSAQETAQDVYRLLTEHGSTRSSQLPAPRHRFLATGDRQPFAAVGRRFLGPDIGVVEALGQVGVMGAIA
ncbi:MAG: glutamate racemase [Sporichthyaceae bacterium]